MRKFLITGLALMLSASGALAACTNFIGINISDGMANKLSLAQLYNPANSGKDLKITALAIAVTTWGATPAGTRAADIVIQSAPFATSGGNTQCKNVGDATPSVAKTYIQQVDPSSQTGVKPFHEFWMGASEVDHTYTFSPPLTVPPGYGVAVRGGQTAMYVVTSWQWSERPVP